MPDQTATNSTAAQTGAQVYSITFKNESNQDSNFVCYQQLSTTPSLGELAWFSEPVAKGASTKLEWRETYEFVWGETGSLAPREIFTAGQSVPAAEQYTNTVELTREGSAIVFANATSLQPPQGFNIRVSTLVPSDMISVGMGMAGSPFAVMQAMRGGLHTFVLDRRTYWIVGAPFKKGEVLDPQQLPNAVQVKFEPNIYNVTATYTPEGGWRLENDLG